MARRARLTNDLCPSERDYWTEVEPILNGRCVVCQSCFDAPCQFKQEAPEGLDRGASKENRTVAAMRSEDDYKKLKARFGVRRTNPEFRAFSDRLHAYEQSIEPLRGGLFDYNRLENG